MYIPKYFKVTDMEEIESFIQQNGFGTIVTTKNGKPIATHLPLLLEKRSDAHYITGHVAYGNPMWRTFETCDDVLVMFQGPHTYVSSSWYKDENVPTWNYQAVHLYGSARVLDEDELQRDLAKLLEKYEAHREHPVLWDKLSPELLKSELRGIVGFEMKVQDVQAAYKLSQNRNEEDYTNIVDRLREEQDAGAGQVADAMAHHRRP